MKNLKNVRYIVAVAAVAAFGFTSNAQAQTQNMDVQVQVTNTMTLTTDAEMDFGEIVAIADVGQTAEVAVNPQTGALGVPTSTGGNAYVAIIDGTGSSETQITVTDAAPGATINIEIQNVVPPTFGGTPFQLNTWMSSWNGGAPAAQAAGVPWTQVYLDNGGAGSILQLGATLETNAAGTAYSDGLYIGSFDVVFSY